MINKVIRLTSPRQFETFSIEENIEENTIVIKPTFLSICHADQRYFTGSRSKEVLNKKLPMALIHEGIGEVVFDKTKKFQIGEKVVIIPNTPSESSPTIHENYLRSSRFRSSGFDGLTQEYVFTNADRIIRVPQNLPDEVAAFTELVSVAMHSICRLSKKINGDSECFGVWGDGNLGFITSLILKNIYPNSKIIIFGKHREKLDYFSFVDEKFLIDEIPKELKISHGIECVGGMGSQDALNQIIDCIKPEGTIGLMGVSERYIEVNTRMILEKGITLIGSSRSGREDFINTLDFLSNYPSASERLSSLVGQVRRINNILELSDFFESDFNSNWGKSVMKWNF